MTWRRSLWLGLAILAALQFALLGLGLVPRQVVEAVHVDGLLPLLRAALGGISAAIPFSIAECLLAVWLLLALGAVFELVRPRSRRRSWWFAGNFARLTILAAWLYLLGHGWSLGRPPLAERLDLPRIATEERAESHRKAALATAESLGRSRAALDAAAISEAPSYEEVGRKAREALLAVLAELGSDATLPPGSIKPCIPAGFLMRFGVSGVFSPFTFEAHVDPSVHPRMLPFVAVHELAHVVGFAGEDEANFVAWLACTRSRDPRFRYSGHLGAGWQFGWDAEMRRRAGPAVDADRRAIVEHQRGRRSKRLAKAQQIVWNAALKGQGVKSGIRSYREMVELMMAWRRRSAPEERSKR